LIKKVIFISYFLVGLATTLFAQSDIVLRDYSQNSILKQKNIQGCIDSSVIVKQKREIKELKKELNRVLRRLSKMEKEIGNPNRKKKRVIKRNKKKRVKRKKVVKIEPKIKGDYIVIRVKRGDTLSKYAQKYYGDKSKYYKIYRVNRDKIGRDLKLHVGDKIVIPIEKSIKKSQTSYKTLKNIKKYNHNLESYVPTYNTPHSTPKITPKPISKVEKKLKMLDEVVYIDDSKNSNQDVIFIPLDEN